jgi:hypothetical protein
MPGANSGGGLYTLTESEVYISTGGAVFLFAPTGANIPPLAVGAKA